MITDRILATYVVQKVSIENTGEFKSYTTTLMGDDWGRS